MIDLLIGNINSSLIAKHTAADAAGLHGLEIIQNWAGLVSVACGLGLMPGLFL